MIEEKTHIVTDVKSEEVDINSEPKEQVLDGVTENENSAETETAEKVEEFKQETDTTETDPMYPLRAATENLSCVSAVFGQSEDEIEREFKAYKAAKLFKKFDLDATGLRGDEEVKSAAENCLKYGFGGIVVLPQYIVTAKKALGGNADVTAAISYPYGEEIPYSTVKSALKAARRGAKNLLVPVGVSFIKRGEFDNVRKTFKKIVKRSKIGVLAVLECGALTTEETERALKILLDCGVKSFRPSTGFFQNSDEFMNLKNLRSAYKNGNTITATANSATSQDAVRLLTIADKISSVKAVEIANEIKEKLDIK